MFARVTVTLKPGVLDPQGKAVESALASLGVAGVTGVRQGKVFDIEIAADDPAAARATLARAAERLLANPVIETYEIWTPEQAPATVAEAPAQDPAQDAGASSAAAAADMPAEGHP